MSQNTSEKAAAEVAAAQRAAEAIEKARRDAAERRPGRGETVVLPEKNTVNEEG